VVENGEKILIAEHAGGDLRIPFDAVLVAVGRAANLTGYGLEELGIPTGRTVETNEFLQTRYPNIYAAGDVAGSLPVHPHRGPPGLVRGGQCAL
jgi:pyruvate/2-oxoglutarate dehydrogenase complex dihydrolipoamide dehydrogenase (E3) component